MSLELSHSGSNSITWLDRLNIIKEYLDASILNLLTTFLFPIKDMISMYFLKYQNDNVAYSAYGFSIMWINMIGTTLLFSCCSGFGVVGKELLDSKNFLKYNQALKQLFLLFTIILLMSSVLILCTSLLTEALGQNEDFAEDVGITSCWLLISHLFFNLSTLMRFIEISLSIKESTRYRGIICIFLHYPITKILVTRFESKLIAVCLARGITDFFGFVINFCIFRGNLPTGGEVNFKLSLNAVDSFENFKEFSMNLIRVGWKSFSDWTFYEISSFIVGFSGSHNSFCAQMICHNYFFIFIGPLSKLANSIAQSINSFATQGMIEQAKNHAYTGVYLLYTLSIAICIITLTFKDQIVSLYTLSPDIQDITSPLFLIMLLGLPACIGGNIHGNILASVYEELELSNSYFLGYGGGLVLALLFGVIFNFDVYGIWLGYSIGFWVYFICTGYDMYRIHWAWQVRRTSRMSMVKILPEGTELGALSLDTS